MITVELRNRPLIARLQLAVAAFATVLTLGVTALPATADAGDLDPAADATAVEHSELEVREHALAMGVEERRALYPDTRFDVGDKVYAWLSVANPHDESHVTLVWHHGGTERWRIELEVGHSRRGWRTWAYKTMRDGDAGAWSVEVVAPDGTVLETLAFDVGTPPADTTLGAASPTSDAAQTVSEGWEGTVDDVLTGC